MMLFLNNVYKKQHTQQTVLSFINHKYIHLLRPQYAATRMLNKCQRSPPIHVIFTYIA